MINFELKTFASEVTDELNELTFDILYDNETLELSSNITLTDDFIDVLFEIELSNEGYMRVSLIFDELEETLTLYQLLNIINEDTIFKAFLDDDNYFVIEIKTNLIKSIEDTIKFLHGFLDEIYDDSFIDLIYSIYNITY